MASADSTLTWLALTSGGMGFCLVVQGSSSSNDHPLKSVAVILSHTVALGFGNLYVALPPAQKQQGCFICIMLVYLTTGMAARVVGFVLRLWG